MDTDFTAAPKPAKAAKAPAWAKPDHENENKVEQHLIDELEKMGGKAYKWSSPAQRSVPDRLLFHPGFRGRLIAVEVKAPGKTPTEGQRKMHEKLVGMGYVVFVVDTKGKVDQLLIDLKKAYRLESRAP